MIRTDGEKEAGEGAGQDSKGAAEGLGEGGAAAMKEGPAESRAGTDAEGADQAREGPAEAAEAPEGEAPDGMAAEEAPEAREMAEAETRYMRLAADFQNYKKRSEKEKSDIYAYANEKFAMDLLEVLDSFERALGQKPEDSEGSAFRSGMEMVLEQLRNVLGKNDVKEIEAEGAAFDPNFHHAVVMDDSGPGESGTVTEVMQKGYMLKGKVIRPAMVMVAK